jgi:hypothetical protein
MMRKGSPKDAKKEDENTTKPQRRIKDPSDQTYYIHNHQKNGQSIVNEERERCGCVYSWIYGILMLMLKFSSRGKNI